MLKRILSLVSLVGLGACGAPDSMMQVGAMLPEFALQNQKGNLVTRDDLLGKRTVLWFYPMAATPG